MIKIISTKAYNKLVGDVEHYQRVAVVHDKQAREWRARYEQVILTPENKIDSEAAFRRGADSARAKMISYLISALQAVEVKDES